MCDDRHKLLTPEHTKLDIRIDLPGAAPSPRLRSRKEMDPRARRVNHYRVTKDKLCVPHMFTFGHVRQFEKVIGDTLGRAWSLGAGPGEHRLVGEYDRTGE